MRLALFNSVPVSGPAIDTAGSGDACEAKSLWRVALCPPSCFRLQTPPPPAMSQSPRSSLERVFSPRSSLEKAFSLFRGRQPRISSDSVSSVSSTETLDGGANWILPAEILLRVFGLFAHRQTPTDDSWLPGHHLTALDRTSLLSVMRVCRAWNGPAREVFYFRIGPRTAAACVALSQTLTRQPRLAMHIQQLVLPEQTKLLGNTAGSYSKLSLKARIALHLLESSLATAVSDIISRCARLDDVRIATGTDDFASATLLAPVSSQLRSLAVSQQQLYIEDTLDLDEVHAAARARQLLGVRRAYKRVYRFDAIRFESLEVLRLSNFVNGAVPAPLGVTVDRFRQAFPKLRMLALSRATIHIEDLSKILAALAPRLEVLSFYAVKVSTGRDQIQHPLVALLSGAIPSTDLESISDLRVLDPAPPSNELWQQLPPKIQWTTETGLDVKRLTLHPTLLTRLDGVPASLEQIQLYYWQHDRTRSASLDTIAYLARKLPAWRTTAPGLTSISQRVPNVLAGELKDWEFACCIMRGICARSDVEVSTDVWYVFLLPS